MADLDIPADYADLLLELLDAQRGPRLRSAAKVWRPRPSPRVTAELFSKERYGYRIGIKPTQIEILTSISGVTFDHASRECVLVTIEDRPVPFIGRAALLDNKRAAGRHKDLADVEALESADDEPR